MKKYVKPVLVVENYELTTQVAACVFDSNNSHTDTKNCWFTQDDTGIIVFASGTVQCEWTPDEIGASGDCYYTGGSDTTSPSLGLFNS